MDVEDDLTPKWWLVRLYAQLMLRNRRTEKFANYYDGEFDTPWLPEEVAEDFKRIVHMTSSNYMGLVVNAMVERMNLIGFRRAGSGALGDLDLWRIWTANHIESQHDQGLLEAAIHGAFYYLVAPGRKDSSLPEIYIEHPTQCIVEHVPGTNRREAAAGLKAWQDDWTKMVYATVYLPDGIYKFQARDPSAFSGDGTFATEMPGERDLPELAAQWEERRVPGEPWPVPNELGEVPLVESPNNPRLLTGGVSELFDLWPIQDRVNKTIADRMMTQDTGAFPQKWASGWPEEDDSGTAQDPLAIGRKRIVTTDVAEARFGQWDAAPLDPYSNAKREDVIDIASLSRTPPHYLISGMSNANGATLKAAESGLVSKVTQRMAAHSAAAVQAMLLACRLAGIEVEDSETLEAMWENPEFRTQAETTDSLIKMRQAADLPRSVVWAKWGATPAEMQMWEELLEEEQRKAAERAMMYDPAAQLAEQMRSAQGAFGDGAPGGGNPPPDTTPSDEWKSSDDRKNGDPLPGAGKRADDPQMVIKPDGLVG